MRIHLYSYIFMCFCGILLENVCIASELPEWKIAEQTILQCYKGRDIEVSVSTGYEHRIYQDGPVDGEFATAMLTVPIYSRKQILEKQNLAHEKIEHLSELYADYQSQSAIVYALDKEKEVLQNTMIDEGAKGISAYYELIKDVEKAKSLRDSAERKIITWLELCGYVATDKTPGKGSPSQ